MLLIKGIAPQPVQIQSPAVPRVGDKLFWTAPNGATATATVVGVGWDLLNGAVNHVEIHVTVP